MSSTSCGAAHWSIALARRGARVTALDNSARQLAYAHDLVARGGVSVTLCHASGESTPFADGSFDVVFSDRGVMAFADPERTVPERRAPACIVAIHGAVANAATWIPLQRILGDAIDVLAADLPGHGTRRNEAFGIESAVTSLTATVLAESAYRPTLVVGDSLGGYLALAVAARAGEAVRGVIGGSCTFPMRGFAGACARASLVLDSLVPAAAIAAVIERSCAADVGSAIRDHGLVPAMRGTTLRALLERDVMGDVANVASPIVFIDGAFDIPIAWYANAFARGARNGRAVIVPFATHGVGLSHPETFAAAARALFARDDVT